MKAQNIGNSALQGVRIVHGPLPYSLTFDAAKSTPQCFLQQKNVECTTDFAVGQTKDLSLVYKTSSYFSCASARFLQTAKAMASTASGSSQVVVGVSCAVETSDAQSSSLSSSASSFSSFSSFAHSGTGFIASSAQQNGTYGSGTFVAQNQPVQDAGKDTGGYKPYIMPRTGAGDYFAAVTSSDFLFTPKGQSTEEPFSTIPLLLLSVLSVVVLLKIRKSSLSR